MRVKGRRDALQLIKQVAGDPFQLRFQFRLSDEDVMFTQEEQR